MIGLRPMTASRDHVTLTAVTAARRSTKTIVALLQQLQSQSTPSSPRASVASVMLHQWIDMVTALTATVDRYVNSVAFAHANDDETIVARTN